MGEPNAPPNKVAGLLKKFSNNLEKEEQEVVAGNTAYNKYYEQHQLEMEKLQRKYAEMEAQMKQLMNNRDYLNPPPYGVGGTGYPSQLDWDRFEREKAEAKRQLEKEIASPTLNREDVDKYMIAKGLDPQDPIERPKAKEILAEEYIKKKKQEFEQRWERKKNELINTAVKGVAAPLMPTYGKNDNGLFNGYNYNLGGGLGGKKKKKNKMEVITEEEFLKHRVDPNNPAVRAMLMQNPLFF